VLLGKDGSQSPYTGRTQLKKSPAARALDETVAKSRHNPLTRGELNSRNTTHYEDSNRRCTGHNPLTRGVVRQAHQPFP